MIGRELILIKSFLLLFVFGAFSHSTQAQVSKELEKKAVTYFCSNVAQIKKELADYNIRFKGHTTGKPSSIYKIADCIGDISLIKDSIPNEIELDSLTKLNESKRYDIIATRPPQKCGFLKKRVFAPFNKRVFTLEVFNAVEYKGEYFVEFYLTNKNLSTWIICMKYSKAGEFLRHYTSYVII